MAKRLFDKSGTISKKKLDMDYFTNKQYHNLAAKLKKKGLSSARQMSSIDGRYG